MDGGVNTANIADIARAGVDTSSPALRSTAPAKDPHRYDTIVGALRAELEKFRV